MRSDQRLEELGYEAGVPKPVFAIIHGECATTVWRWIEADHFRDLLIEDPEPLNDDQLRDEITRKVTLGLTTIPVDPVDDEDL